MRTLGLLVLACLGAAGIARASDAAYTVVSPLFGFSNRPYFTNSHERSNRVVSQVQVMPSFSGSIQSLLQASTGASPSEPGLQENSDTVGVLLDRRAIAERPPDVVVVMLGTQLHTSDLRKHSPTGVLQPLQELMESTNSISVPYLLHKPESAPINLDAVLAYLKANSGTTINTVGCNEGRSLADVRTLLEDEEKANLGKPLVLVVCVSGNVPSAATPEALASEVDSVSEVHAHVRACCAAKPGTEALRERSYLALYALQPPVAEGSEGTASAGTVAEAPASESTARRRLHVSEEVYKECDELCQTQVKYLEGILVVLLLALAALSGLCCLNVLDTPTRFETSKDSSRTDS